VRNTWKIMCIILGCFVLLLLLLPLVFWGLGKYTEIQENSWYVTDELLKYGEITHNGDNTIPAEFIHSFFPARIEPYFENVKYKYKARDWCDYCCEMYLEFSIPDRQLFNEYVKSVVQIDQVVEFPFDDRYDEFSINDDLYVTETDYQEESGGYYLDGAKMGIILVDDEAQKVVYHAVMVTNCCGTDTNYIDFYRDYNIDPLDYAEKRID